MARANVPRFGNWDSEENVPYTVYFEKARKNKGGKLINPNDPQENPELFAHMDPSPPAPSHPPPSRPRTKPEEPTRVGAVRPSPEHRSSREESDYKQFYNSPARGENVGQKSTNESNYGGRGQRPARSTKPSVGSELSFERSPLHPHYQGKVVGKATGSPAWEGRNNESSHAAGGKTRLKPASQGDESPDSGATVPKFGAWDENDPQSAENFTNIFNKVREERNTGAGNVSGTPRHPSQGGRTQKPVESKACCCFGW